MEEALTVTAPEVSDTPLKCVRGWLMDNQTLRAECQGQTSLHALFGMGRTCTCAETKLPDCQQTCGSCRHQESLWQLGCEAATNLGFERNQVQGVQGGSGETGNSGKPPGPQEGMCAGSSWECPRAQAETSYYNREQQEQMEAHAQDLLAKQDYSCKACASLLERCQGLGRVNARRMSVGRSGMQMILGRYICTAVFKAHRERHTHISVYCAVHKQLPNIPEESCGMKCRTSTQDPMLRYNRLRTARSYVAECVQLGILWCSWS